MFLKALLISFSAVSVYCTTFDYDVLWIEGNSTIPSEYKGKSKIPDALKGATKIELNQKLPVLQDFNVSFVSNLKSIVMDGKDITTILAGTFTNISNLEIENMTITNNNIKVISENVFNGLQIQVLNLTGNKIETISSEAFNHMKNLKEVILDSNELKTYDIQFKGCPKLLTINAKLNFIETFTEHIFKEIKDNKLTVDFSYNKVNSVHKSAFDIKEFGVVRLDHNELKDANILIKLSKAEKVDLSNNNIECLPKEFMENGLSKIKVLNLTSNPLTCPCLNDLKKKMKKNIEFQKMSPLVKNINIILPEKECTKKK